METKFGLPESVVVKKRGGARPNSGRKRVLSDAERKARAAARARLWRARKAELRRASRIPIDPAIKKQQWKLSQLNGFLKRRYGISLQEFSSLAEAQKGLCGCCGRKPLRRLVVDHCHLSGKIRGLLCHQCNSALGLLGDSVDGVVNLLRYIEAHA